MTIRSGSSMNSSSSTDASTNQSSTKALINRFDSSALCFDERHRMHDCSLIPESQKRRIAQVRHFNIRISQRRDANQYGAPQKPTSTERESASNERCNRYPQLQRSKYRRNDRRKQKNWSGKENRWKLLITNPTKRPKENPQKLPSKERCYF